MTQLLKIAIFVIISTSCLNNVHDGIEPIKKIGIPENAFWVGGDFGVNWYEVKYIHDHKNYAFIGIYSDKDGSLIVEKKFIVVCPANKPTWIEDLKTQIIGFDGEKIYLKSLDGRRDCWMQ